MRKVPDTTTYDAVEAIVIYSCSDRGRSMMHDSFKDLFKPEKPAFYATSNPIVNGSISAGKPLTHERILDVCHKFMPHAVKTVYLPENIVSYASGLEIIWWVPARPRKIYFKKSSSLNTGMTPLPALLFRARANNLDVWAIKENKRPTLDTDLYYPPFPNMLEPGHHVCTGNAKLPSTVAVSSINAWEKVFFKSYFTTADAVSETRIKEIAWKKLWKELLSGEHKGFPDQYLVKFGTLGKLFRQEMEA